MYSKGDIGKIAPVVSQSCNYKHTTTFGTWKKKTFGELQSFLIEIFVYCTYGKEDIGKISTVVSHSHNYKCTTAFVTWKKPFWWITVIVF